MFHPYAMAVFEDKLYWTDWATSSLDMCDKHTGRHHSMLIRETEQMMGVHVYHPLLHGPAHDPCWANQVWPITDVAEPIDVTDAVFASVFDGAEKTIRVCVSAAYEART